MSDEWLDVRRARGGVTGLQQMLRRNKAAGERLAQRVFRLLVLRSMTAATRQFHAAQKPDGRLSQGERREAPDHAVALIVRQPASMHRCCTCTPRGRVVADDICLLSIRAAV
ncbi:hypothetical protein [Burkholderia cenocepacia]|uniref:hypothetical protein n=1 Tax=Burkholderia cenocepacia TaxID=95486 RepID=UPI002AAF1A01|nr:hypothetical protein [Burkholderia cenocepacia]